MVKKLQALKAKKGFTLVELVVVIAIIGILAAILVPTMLGVVQDSRITSANTVAGNVKNRITEFFAKLDSLKHSYIGGEAGKYKEVEVTVDKDSWTIGGLAAKDFMQGTTTVDYSGPTCDRKTFTDKDTSLAEYMADSMSDVKTLYAKAYLSDQGKVVGVYCVEGSTTAAGGDEPTAQEFLDGERAWTGKKAGVSTNSVIVGCAPVIEHKKGS